MTSSGSVAPVQLNDPNEQWTTFLDRAVIDHAMASPTLRPRVGSTLIYAFDLDPALDENQAGDSH